VVGLVDLSSRLLECSFPLHSRYGVVVCLIQAEDNLGGNEDMKQLGTKQRSLGFPQRLVLPMGTVRVLPLELRNRLALQRVLVP